MLRFQFTSYLFTENKLTEQVESFAQDKKLELEQLCHNGALAFRLTGVDAVIELVFMNREKTVFIDIESGIDVVKHLEIIGFLTKRGFINHSELEAKSSPHDCTEKVLDYVSEIISGKKKPELPVVYLSRTGNGHAYGCDIDEQKLAHDLFGIAHVIIEGSSEDTQRLRKRLSKQKNWEPRNGYIGIYYPSGDYEIIRELSTSSERFDSGRKIVSIIAERASATAKPGRLTFDKLALKSERSKPQKTKTVVKDEQLRAQMETLERENESLKETITKKDKLIEKMRKKNQPLDVLNMPDAEESRPGEFRDFLIALIKHADKTIPEQYRRVKALTKAFLSTNEQSDYESTLCGALKRDFDSGKKITAVLTEKYGFSLERAKKHYIFEFAGQTQSLSCTPGDCRSRDNEISYLKKTFLCTFF